MTRIGFTALFVLLLGGPAAAVDCESKTIDDVRYTLCEVFPAQDTLRLFLYNKDNAPYGQFSAIDNALAEQGQKLAFAMNAGMYHDDRSPVGQYIEDGQEVMRLITNPGPGNFGLLPNGVLCLRPGRADVIETLRYEKEAPDCESATQSGPMLVIDGELHPRFLEDGTSKHIRNGVGTSADGKRAVFVISDEPVNFHTFGSLFRDHLGLPNALFLDGSISRLYAPDLNRIGFGFSLGPIIGVVEPSAP
jgi:uncharacterized protein YigE (DUF2233 family)